MLNKTRGFTLVELMTVIAIIGVLATVVVVAYNGAQGRARDAKRLTDVNTITKALDVYKARNGSYPNEQSSSWETTLAYPTSFINDLVTSSTISFVPVDPINSGTYYYQYYRYPAGNYGCDATRGEYYVLMIKKGETDGTKSSSSPGFSCPSRDWQTEGWWVTGDYTF